MQLKVINSFLAKTVLDDDVIGLTPLKAGRYPIKALKMSNMKLSNPKHGFATLPVMSLSK
jgi:hypothetical protein